MRFSIIFYLVFSLKLIPGSNVYFVLLCFFVVQKLLFDINYFLAFYFFFYESFVWPIFFCIYKSFHLKSFYLNIFLTNFFLLKCIDGLTKLLQYTWLPGVQCILVLFWNYYILSLGVFILFCGSYHWSSIIPAKLELSKLFLVLSWWYQVKKFLADQKCDWNVNRVTRRSWEPQKP